MIPLVPQGFKSEGSQSLRTPCSNMIQVHNAAMCHNWRLHMICLEEYQVIYNVRWVRLLWQRNRSNTVLAAIVILRYAGRIPNEQLLSLLGAFL